MECDIIIYNITGYPEQVDEAHWAVTGRQTGGWLDGQTDTDRSNIIIHIHTYILYIPVLKFLW